MVKLQAKEARRREAERNYEIWKRRSDEAIRERMRNEKEKAEALAKEKTEEMRRKKEEASKVGSGKCRGREKETEVLNLTYVPSFS